MFFGRIIGAINILGGLIIKFIAFIRFKCKNSFQNGFELFKHFTVQLIAFSSISVSEQLHSIWICTKVRRKRPRRIFSSKLSLMALLSSLYLGTTMGARVLFQWILGGLILTFLLKTTLSLNPDDPNVCSHWER